MDVLYDDFDSFILRMVVHVDDQVVVARVVS